MTGQLTGPMSTGITVEISNNELYPFSLNNIILTPMAQQNPPSIRAATSACGVAFR